MHQKSKHKNALYDEWEKRWEGMEDEKKITSLGHLMFRQKKNKLKEVIGVLDAKTAIDVGCALGHTLEILCDSKLDCLGIDVAESAVSACLRRNLPAQIQDVGNVQEKYDVVFSDGMLEHFLNFEPYVEDFCRISNRYVVLIQPNHESFIGKTIVYFAELLRGSTNIFEYNYRISDFITVFKRHGFDIVDNQPIFLDVFRLLVFRRMKS